MILQNLKIYLIFASFCALSRSEQSLSAETRKISHQIATGRGLYTEYDKIELLNATNFRNEVHSNTSTKSWFVEFYSSWCGHCQRFAPKWKTLAQEMHGWRNIVRIAAVDCSNPFNTPLCRDYEVMSYPNLRYFPSGSSQDFLGILITAREVPTIREFVVSQLRNESEKRSDIHDLFTPYQGSIDEIWQGNNEFAVMALENTSSSTGVELALDFNTIANIKVFIVPLENTKVRYKINDEGVFLINKGSSQYEKIGSYNDSHLILYNKIRSLLSAKGINIPKLENKNITVVPVSPDLVIELIKIDQMVKEKLKKNKINDMVFQVDIEGALRQTLFVEIPSHKEIKGEKLASLKLYLKTLADLFPIGENGKHFLRCLRDVVLSKNEIKGSDFISEVKSCEEGNSPVYMSTGGWIGCRGSEPQFRGYPCALWTMFHTLVVQAHLYPPVEPKQPLRAMRGYITHFFGCTDCSQHFQAMAETIEGNVTDTNSSILWLWKAHNNVNKRLHKDPTEDPKHPKVQFPPVDVCAECHEGAESWREDKVLEFLKNMYTNISYLSLSDLPTTTDFPAIPAKLIRHEVIVDERGGVKFEKSDIHSSWDLSLIDLFLGTALYLTSIVIIGLVCIKLCKKYQRKKHALSSWDMADIFQKV
ncbi:hypothetical protein O3M35_002797 [Rhynocoris fuscipes]|uniref:Sulfhydryl oxidase n=1 Tax=Rhynocoris fuscipes TaxID=488301 RepID=A0AAW1CLM8_9HEMI